MTKKKRSSHYARNVDAWPSFTVETVSEAAAAERAEFADLAHRYIGRRFAADPEARAEVEALLFAPTIERPTYYGRTPARRAS